MRTPSPYAAQFAEMMRTCQTRLKVDLAGLAKLADVPASTMYKWVSCHSSPSAKRAKAVCIKLGISDDWLNRPETNLMAELKESYLTLAGQVYFWQKLRAARDVLGAVQMQTIVMTTLHYRLNDAGVACNLVGNSDINTTIWFTDKNQGFGLVAYLTEDRGEFLAKMNVIDTTYAIGGRVVNVDDAGLKMMITLLKAPNDALSRISRPDRPSEWNSASGVSAAA